MIRKAEPTTGAQQNGGEGFLNRWARRKRQARLKGADFKADRQAAPSAPPPSTTSSSAMPMDEKGIESAFAQNPREVEPHDPENAAAENIPLPEDLADIDPERVDPAELDYARLMQDDVPDDFRRRLLRRLWETDDTLANPDGLNDYDEDFTPAGITATAIAFFRHVARASPEENRDGNAAAAPNSPGSSPHTGKVPAAEVSETPSSEREGEGAIEPALRDREKPPARE